MPQDTATVRRVTYRLPEDLVAAIERLAKAETRPINSQVTVLLREALAARDASSRTSEKSRKR
jgi:hypothetical protein